MRVKKGGARFRRSKNLKKKPPPPPDVPRFFNTLFHGKIK
nr:MAG TPA: hypothetical protein [Caudoviricetes sp.]DAO48611.1 MAG TPA: hypothetical protein [Caudoviricetes sp.]